MKGGVSIGGSCPKINNPCPDLQQEKEEDECAVPCKYEEIKKIRTFYMGRTKKRNVKNLKKKSKHSCLASMKI
jgi:hypothetical protein